MKINNNIIKRFWRKVHKEKDCWEWKAGFFSNGYGVFSPCHTETVRAHRYSYAITKGKIPNGLCVLHKCDNKRCVNPSHLFIGTQIDNVRDRDKKGRTFKGKNPKLSRPGALNNVSKLTEKKVIKIRKLYSTGNYTHRSLANLYGVSHRAIGLITSRKKWIHI